MHALFVLGVLEQALPARHGLCPSALIHRVDCPSQYLSFRYSTRLIETGIESSAGS